jgi:hypothetical protein
MAYPAASRGRVVRPGPSHRAVRVGEPARLEAVPLAVDAGPSGEPPAIRASVAAKSQMVVPW